jgi:protein transport protein SEC61 subunit gamma and related proteins
MGIIEKLTSFILQSKRVWHVLRKPTGAEFSTIAKVSALGILIIGAIGFAIADAIKFFIG